MAVLAAVAGWSAAAALRPAAPRPAPAAAPVTVDDAPETRDPEPPAAVASSGPPSPAANPAPTPPPVASAPPVPSVPPAAPPAVPGGPRPGAHGVTAPAPAPAPRPSPGPTDPVPVPPPAPAPPPAEPSVRPYAPPPTARIPADGLVDLAESVRTLRQVRAAAAPGSAIDRDIGWLLELYDRFRDDPRAGRRATVVRTMRINAWWYRDRGAARRRVILRDPDGILATYRGGHGFAVNPVATTGRWRDLNAELAPERLAEPLLQMAVPRERDGAHALVWEYFDVPEDPAAIRPGASGMAQGRMAELLSSAYHRTGDVRYAEAAGDALAAMDIPVDDGGVRSEVAWPRGSAPHPWFVERAFPGADPLRGAALNGFMVSVLSLRSTALRLAQPPAPGVAVAASVAAPGPPAETTTATGPGRVATSTAPAVGPDPTALRAAAHARSLADAGADTLRAMLPAHDTGTWSLYSLVSPGRADGTYLADLNYHCYHVHLLRALAVGFDDAVFSRTADRWEGYVHDRGATCPER